MSPPLFAGKKEMKSCSVSESGLDSALECRWLSVHSRRLLHANLDDSKRVSDPQALTGSDLTRNRIQGDIRRHQAYL